jgi:glyceraldehyde-3-phosphate dehydrogenase [NAD(P)+]
LGENILELKDPLYKEIYEVKEGIYRFKTFIAGEWVSGKHATRVRSPINNEVIAEVPRLEWEVIDEALEKIWKTGRWSIRDMPGAKRLEVLHRIADLMEEHSDDLVEALVVNAGKTYAQARGEVNASIDRLRRAELDARKIFGEYVPGDWDATTLETEAIVRKEPFGTVLAIIPFNYPLFDSVSKFTYSMIPGNAVVIKPPSADPLPVLLFAKLVEESGMPRESFAVLTLPGRESDRLVSDDRIQVVSLTGSSETGRHVLSVAGIKQFVMELGGGDPAIVLGDADLDLAADRIAQGIYSYTGQRCDAIKLILVAKDVYSEFKDLLVSKLSNYKVGDPRCPATSIGPLITPEAADRMMNAVKEAVDKGGSVIYGGRRLGETYVEPTLIEVADKDKLVSLRLYSDEIFAPVALIAPIENIDEAIKLVNNRRYGLDAAIFGRDVNSIRKLIRYLEVGAIYVNEYPRHGIGYYPFGGRKDSGIGREGIGYSIEEVTAWKTIVYNYRGKGVWRYLV